MVGAEHRTIVAAAASKPLAKQRKIRFANGQKKAHSPVIIGS
jgi:hypothetical protein